jgi:Fic family protein
MLNMLIIPALWKEASWIEKSLKILPKKPNNFVMSTYEELELQKREAAGVIRASRFVRKFAHSRQAISCEVINKIHKCIFEEAWPEIAGTWRSENVKITDSTHLPPHFSRVEFLMEDFKLELEKNLDELKSVENILVKNHELTDENFESVDKIVSVSAWLHHQITYIHPFREGNGRTARLAGNLILERYGLVGISIKIEKENKNRYRKALAQADNMKHKDLEPLKELIFEGLVDRFSGTPVKYIKKIN